jgi:hypothetical protein
LGDDDASDQDSGGIRDSFPAGLHVLQESSMARKYVAARGRNTPEKSVIAAAARFVKAVRDT